MRMSKLFTLFVVLMLALLAFNCSDDDDDDGIIPERYVGTWEAKIDIEGTLIQYATLDVPPVELDLRLLGAEIKAILRKDGTYSLTFVDPIEGTDTDAGTITLNEEAKVITLNSNSDEDLIFAYEWEGDILVLETMAEFDFGQGDVPAEVTIKLKRTAS
jgi:hypothetical protein